MHFTPLPLLSPLAAYDAQARALLAAHAARDPAAIEFLHHRHPRFLDPDVPWKPGPVASGEITSAALDLDDARLAVARSYDFRNWEALEALVGTMAVTDSPDRAFESAVDAVISGDMGTLDRMLLEEPGLATARSSRVTCFDPPVHGATLLHYVAANGVEGYRQRSPPNAVVVARRILQAGADVNATARMYGGECATLPLLVSSTPPAAAGVQVPLVHALLDAGAAIDGLGSGPWCSPLLTALVFGFLDAAEALVSRGARVDGLVSAAGLGRTEEVGQLLGEATGEDRHRALALASQLGRGSIVRTLLEAGEDPNRFNPPGFHGHATPLHHAALAGHAEVVRVLLESGARLDIRDTLWNGTPLGWAEYAGHTAVAEQLRAAGAEPEG